MGPHLAAVEEEIAIERDAAARIDVDFGHPSPNAIRIELRVPRCVEAVGDVDAFAVAADFDHLWSAVERLPWLARMRRAAGDAAEPDRTNFFRIEWVGHVVLEKLAGSPARHVEKSIVDGEIDVGHKRSDGHESQGNRMTR